MKKYNMGSWVYRQHMKHYCENADGRLGFECPTNVDYIKQQMHEDVFVGCLDVDHIDGNHDNNDPQNLQTLCKTCHYVKTHINKDWETKQENCDNA